MNLRRTLLFVPATLLWVVAARAQHDTIDPAKSTMTVRVYKAGLLSALGHDHEISAPIAGGAADKAAQRVEVRVDAKALRVRDPGTSQKDRDEIQRTMLGPEVLDADAYPEIAFRSESVEPAGPGSWSVRGSLTLHGQTKPVTLAVKEESGHYVGSSRFKITDFGIKPVKAAGGTIKVKDEIRVEFDIHLEH